jgi:hypothetical protein
MNIGLIDVDGHNFPNVALMKIASWHRQQGDTAEWAMPMFGSYDRIYASKVFTFTQDYNRLEYRASEFVGGGVLGMISRADCHRKSTAIADWLTIYIRSIASRCSSIVAVASGIARSVWYTTRKARYTPWSRWSGTQGPSG